jgi:hypothetical protein
VIYADRVDDSPVVREAVDGLSRLKGVDRNAFAARNYLSIDAHLIFL